MILNICLINKLALFSIRPKAQFVADLGGAYNIIVKFSPPLRAGSNNKNTLGAALRIKISIRPSVPGIWE